MFMFMQEKITWRTCWALVGPAFPLLGPFPVINVRYKLRQQPILPTVKFSIWAAAHKPNALRHRGREAASARDIFLWKEIFFSMIFSFSQIFWFSKIFLFAKIFSTRDFQDISHSMHFRFQGNILFQRYFQQQIIERRSLPIEKYQNSESTKKVILEIDQHWSQ